MNSYPKYGVISWEFELSFNETSNSDETNTELNDNFVKHYRIDTNGCKIKDLPLFDEQIEWFFKNKSKTIWKCTKNIINIQRINGTAIRVDWSTLGYKPVCFYRQLSRGEDDYHNVYGMCLVKIELVLSRVYQG